jgi:hypothetical protein
MSTEKIVGNSEGVFTVQSIHRKPEEDRWSGTQVKQLRGFPWLPNPGEVDETQLREPIVVMPERPEVRVERPAALEPASGSRRVYIRQSDLEVYGYTVGCQVCDTLRAGLPRPAGTNHSDVCRKRIEEAMVNDGGANQERYTRAYLKRMEEEERQEAEAKKARVEEPELDVGDPQVAAGSAGLIPVPEEDDAELREAPKREAEAASGSRPKTRKKDPSKRSSDEPSSPSASPGRRARMASHRGEGSVADPDDEVMGLICELREAYFDAVYEKRGDRPVCEEPEPITDDDSEFHEYLQAWDDVSGKTLAPQRGAGSPRGGN